MGITIQKPKQMIQKLSEVNPGQFFIFTSEDGPDSVGNRIYRRCKDSELELDLIVGVGSGTIDNFQDYITGEDECVELIPAGSRIVLDFVYGGEI